MSSVIGALSPSLLNASLLCVSTFSLTAFIRPDHYILPLLSCLSLCLSSYPSLPNERETLVCLRLAGSRARGGKMRRKKEGRWRQREGMRKEGAKRKGTVCSDCKWCERGGEFVLEGWLVSVRTLWEGNWRTTVVGLLDLELEFLSCCVPSAVAFKITLKTMSLEKHPLYAQCHFRWAFVFWILLVQSLFLWNQFLNCTALLIGKVKNSNTSP